MSIVRMKVDGQLPSGTTRKNKELLFSMLGHLQKSDDFVLWKIQAHSKEVMRF